MSWNSGDSWNLGDSLSLGISWLCGDLGLSPACRRMLARKVQGHARLLLAQDPFDTGDGSDGPLDELPEPLVQYAAQAMLAYARDAARHAAARIICPEIFGGSSRVDARALATRLASHVVALERLASKIPETPDTPEIPETRQLVVPGNDAVGTAQRLVHACDRAWGLNVSQSRRCCQLTAPLVGALFDVYGDPDTCACLREQEAVQKFVSRVSSSKVWIPFLRYASVCVYSPNDPAWRVESAAPLACKLCQALLDSDCVRDDARAKEMRSTIASLQSPNAEDDALDELRWTSEILQQHAHQVAHCARSAEEGQISINELLFTRRIVTAVDGLHDDLHAPHVGVHAHSWLAARVASQEWLWDTIARWRTHEMMAQCKAVAASLQFCRAWWERCCTDDAGQVAQHFCDLAVALDHPDVRGDNNPADESPVAFVQSAFDQATDASGRIDPARHHQGIHTDDALALQKAHMTTHLLMHAHERSNCALNARPQSTQRRP